MNAAEITRQLEGAIPSIIMGIEKMEEGMG